MKGYGIQTASACVGVGLGVVVVWLSIQLVLALKPAPPQLPSGDFFDGILLYGLIAIVWIAMCVGLGAFHGWRLGTKLMMRRVERILGSDDE